MEKKYDLANWMNEKGYPLIDIQISNSFLAARIVNDLAFVSSATPLRFDGTEVIGKVGEKVNLEDAKEAARLCLAHSLSLLQCVLNVPIEERLSKVVDLTFMINGIPSFGNHSVIADAASDLLIEYFGEDGKHSRSAVGVGSLVRNCSVVLKATYELK